MNAEVGETSNLAAQAKKDELLTQQERLARMVSEVTRIHDRMPEVTESAVQPTSPWVSSSFETAYSVGSVWVCTPTHLSRDDGSILTLPQQRVKFGALIRSPAPAKGLDIVLSPRVESGGIDAGAQDGIARRPGLDRHRRRKGDRPGVLSRTCRRGQRDRGSRPSGSLPTVGEIEALGGRAIGVEVDVRDMASTEDMAQAAVGRFERIDVLVNNAAYYTTVVSAPFEKLTVDEWDKAFAVNVRGSWLCARAVAPFMRAQGSGSIINISSMTVADGTPNFLHYVSTKAAVIGLTRAMARELGDDGIAVNTVTPDYIPHDQDYAARQGDWLNDWIESGRCFKRQQVPDDMVGTVVFLASPLSSFMTGQNLVVNGGRRFF